MNTESAERYGAHLADWIRLQQLAGIGEDLLPVVCNPNAQRSPGSKVKKPGKVPTVYNANREYRGIVGWTGKKATPAGIERWSSEPDYGVCVQTRLVRAIDGDINDAALSRELQEIVLDILGVVPTRRRANSPRFLSAFILRGEYPKRTIRTAHGIIEFLGNGQQFIAAGQHESGARYEWDSGVPDEFPVKSAEQFEAVWTALSRYAIEPPAKNMNTRPECSQKGLTPGDIGGTTFDRAAAVAGVPEGERDTTLFKYACSLRARGVDQAEAEVLVLKAAANCTPPFPEMEARAKVAAAYKKYPAGAADTPQERTLRELAALPPLEYDTRRVAVAKAWGVRVNNLDIEVAKRRAVADDATQDTVVEEIEPWEEPVNGATLLAEFRAIIERHVILPTGAALALSLWVLGSYCMDAWRLFPKLLLSSPQKRCGKTTLLEIIEGLLYRSLLAANTSAAALFRSIEEWHPSLLLDEADTFVKDNEELNGVINAGHTRRTAYVLRCEKIGETIVPCKFAVWGAQVLAGIGRQRDTLLDRSIHIEMRRRANDERCEKLPIDHFERSLPLRRRALRWAVDNSKALKAAIPEVPPYGNDRCRDNWGPLFALAGLAQGEWPAHARAAFVALNEMVEEDSTTGSMLLADIREVFATQPTGRMFSDDLVRALALLDDRPWCDWSHGRALKASGLAKLLGAYKIHSRNIRSGTAVRKGYTLDDFHDAFTRYLPVLSADTPFSTATPLQMNEVNDIRDFEGATPPDAVAALKCDNTLKNNDCSGVAVENPPHRDTGDLARTFDWIASRKSLRTAYVKDFA
jgi:Protein of unknown function (DUF3631)/Primase C terminal 1 (PriCT-1)